MLMISSKNENSPRAGIGFFGLLTMAFIVLKLTGVIGWSWIWVVAPIWIPIAIAVGILILAILVQLIRHFMT